MRADSWASLAGAALCALLIAADAAAAHNPKAPDPKAIVLPISDVPAGLTVSSQGYESLTEAAAGGPFTAAQYKAWGYLSGYEVHYELAGSAAKVVTGPVLITSSASVYKTPAGAAASLAASRAQCPKNGGHSFSPGGRIGDQSFGCVVNVTENGVPLVDYVVGWHRGPVKEGIVLGGTPTGASAAQTVRLARLVDKRIPG